MLALVAIIMAVVPSLEVRALRQRVHLIETELRGDEPLET